MEGGVSGWRRKVQAVVMAVVMAASASAGLGLVSPAQAVDVVNGSLSGMPTNGGVPAGWTTLRDSPDINDVDNNTGLPYYRFAATPSASPDGGTWVGLGVAPASNFLERFGQTVGGFTVGARYTVTWFASNFGFASFSGAANNLDDPAQINLLVDGQSVGHGATLVLQPGWASQSLTFTATATTHALAFGASTLGSSSYVGIDGIGVAVAAVPEPASTALLLAGLCGLAAVVRRRAVPSGMRTH
jgi:hypothetical protein